MRYFVLFMAMAAAPLAFAATATQDTRTYGITNALTKDQNMSPHVPCSNSSLDLAFQVKCLSHTSWQAVRVNTSSSLTCPKTDSGIHYRDISYDDYDSTIHRTVDWQCGLDSSSAPDGAKRSKQFVSFTGDLSLCLDHPVITATPSCRYYND